LSPLIEKNQVRRALCGGENRDRFIDNRDRAGLNGIDSTIGPRTVSGDSDLQDSRERLRMKAKKRLTAEEARAVKQVLAALKTERVRVDRAITALSDLGKEPGHASSERKRTRTMSAEARAKIAGAQRERWAKVKAVKKK